MKSLLKYLLFLLSVVLSAATYTTTLIESSAPTSKSWLGVASSSSGQYLVASSGSSSGKNDIYTSSNYGYNWNKSNASDSVEWQFVASSSSGQFMYANGLVSSSYFVYYSNTYGNNWIQSSSANNGIGAIATSASGQYVYIVNGNYYLNSFGTGLFVSSDYGRTFTIAPNTDSFQGVSVACSSDGQFVFVAGLYNLYTSNNYFLTFNTSSATLPDDSWTAVTSDSSGQYLAAASFYQGIYTSQDYGATFVSQTLAPFDTVWMSIASSASGQYLYATEDNGIVYYSSDFGSSWTAMNVGPKDWYGVTCSSSGQYVAAVVNGGGIYLNLYTPTSLPTSSPSLIPSAQPSSAPSSVTAPPTSFPSSQPSSYPTYIPGTLDVSAVVQSSELSSSFVFNNLGCNSRVYLTASIEVSYLDKNSNGYLNITAGTGSNLMIVSEDCSPAATCGTVSCAINMDVSSAVSCEGGGSVRLVAQVVNANKQTGIQTFCVYLGSYNLYAVAYTLSYFPQPTALPTFAPTEAGNFIFNASPNAPFFVIAVFTLVFVSVGVIIVQLRNKAKDVFAGTSLCSTCLDMAMSGYSLASELFYLIVLFSQNLFAFAAIIIIIRLSSTLIAVYLCVITLGPAPYSMQYEKYLNKSHLFKFISTYAGLIVLMMFDHTLIVYFPWYNNNYIAQSGGFPNRVLFKTCMIPKLILLLCALLIQVLVLSVSDSKLLVDKSDQISLALVLLYLISSVLSVIMFGISLFVRMKLDDNHSNGNSDVKNIEEGSAALQHKSMKIVNPIQSSGGTELTLRKSENSQSALTNELNRILYLEEREVLLSNELEAMKGKLENKITLEADLTNKIAILEDRLNALENYSSNILI